MSKCLGCNSDKAPVVFEWDDIEPGWICLLCGYWNIPGEALAEAYREGAQVTVQRGKEWQAQVDGWYDETKKAMDEIAEQLGAKDAREAGGCEQ
jgi:hypothetical protein